ncbi:MAG TPA: Eco47II family restriction endonuclease [Thermosynechococcus sp. M46_R2017_013]|nr:Eco47II family restriction endonuclease [Thermosynechococcus sp. M46_R2017_013]
MKQTIDSDSKVTCFLVEVISKESKQVPWSVKIDNQVITDERIIIISIDQFYKIATDQKDAFAKLCKKLPQVIRDVIESKEVEIGFSSETVNTMESLRKVHSDLLKALYYLAFSNYEGFADFAQDQ